MLAGHCSELTVLHLLNLVVGIKPLVTYRAGRHWLFKTELDVASVRLEWHLQDGKLENFGYGLGASTDKVIDFTDISIGFVYLF